MILRKLKRRALRTVGSSTLLTCALFVADGLLARIRGCSTNDDEHLSGVNLEDDYIYSKYVADQYLGNGLAHGKIAEVGPGGNAAVALHLLANGAESVDLIDRFQFSHNRSKLDELYRRFDNFSDLSSVKFHVGEQASAERFFNSGRKYDAIFSCAVLEHLSDPISALSAMASSLNPGGRMVHQVDLRDHGMFSSAGKHELTFLTIGDWIYGLMSEARGRPNRVLIDCYRRTLSACNLEFRVLATHLIEIGKLPEPMELDQIAKTLLEQARESVARIRPKLIERFRRMQVDDLIVSGIRIEATKAAS
jgi:SAM-dependent methyltransferase